jgi:hypothetical protein
MAILVQKYISNQHALLVEDHQGLARQGGRPGGAQFLEAMLRRGQMIAIEYLDLINIGAMPPGVRGCALPESPALGSPSDKGVQECVSAGDSGKQVETLRLSGVGGRLLGRGFAGGVTGQHFVHDVFWHIKSCCASLCHDGRQIEQAAFCRDFEHPQRAGDRDSARDGGIVGVTVVGHQQWCLVLVHEPHSFLLALA